METLFQESGPRTSLALPPRTVLNDTYEVGRVLGKGGFGITYAALDMHLKVPVAIKEYLPAQVAGRGTDRSTVQPHGGKEVDVFEHGLNAFLSEAQTLAQFNHPNIVQVRAFFRQNGTGYLVMPFYEGRTLDAVMADHDGPMPCDEAVALVEPVMDGLEAVHGRNLLHRDIKPQNVYLTDSGETILLDFGAARIAFGQESQSLSAVLTPGYAPFEQYSRRGHQGPWTDVYATAAMLYRMVTGDKPPEATDRLAGEPLAPIHLKNPSATPAFANAVTTALATLPKDRPQTIADFRTMLKGSVADPTLLAGDETVLATDETILTPEATILDRTGPASPEASGEQDTTPGATVLVVRAAEACRFRIDGGEIVSLAKGEERSVPVEPGQHVVAAAFGDQRHKTTVQVRRSERRVVPLAPPGPGRRGRSRQRVEGDRPRTSYGWLWAIGGAGALLVLLIVIGLAVDGNGLAPNNPSNVVGPGGDVEPVPPVAPPQDSSPDYVFNVIGDPVTATGVLAAGDGTLPNGEFADLYTFDSAQSNYLFAELTSQDFDTYLILMGPDGEVIIENDDFDGNLQVSYFDIDLPEPGIYRVFVTSAHPGETGRYTLTLTPDFL